MLKFTKNLLLTALCVAPSLAAADSFTCTHSEHKPGTELTQISDGAMTVNLGEMISSKEIVLNSRRRGDGTKLYWNTLTLDNGQTVNYKIEQIGTSFEYEFTRQDGSKSFGSVPDSGEKSITLGGHDSTVGRPTLYKDICVLTRN